MYVSLVKMPSINPHPAAKTFSDSATAVQSSLSHIDPRLAENATVIFIERIFMDAASVFLVVGAIYACAVFIFPRLAKNLPQDTLDTMLRIQKMLRRENMPTDVYKRLLGRYQRYGWNFMQLKGCQLMYTSHLRLHKGIATIVVGSQNDNKFDPIRRINRSRAWTKANKEAHLLLKDAKVRHAICFMNTQLILPNSYWP